MYFTYKESQKFQIRNLYLQNIRSFGQQNFFLFTSPSLP